MSDPASSVQPRIVFQDADLLVLDKPSGLSTTSPDGENCLAAFAKRMDPKAARMHASSRLDAEVTGIVTFARSDRAIGALLEARKAGAYERTYVGLASKPLEPPCGEWRWAIGQDPRDARKRVALLQDAEAGSQAHSRYQTHAPMNEGACVLLFPQTGRTHQLRVHVAKAGAALFGDRHYGGPAQVTRSDGRVIRARRVMLHCTRVVLPMFDGTGQRVLEAEIPADMRAFFRELGGDEAALSLPNIPRDPKLAP
jgi:23S rRNA-/tRNA-specific pseudouridylate synthase